MIAHALMMWGTLVYFFTLEYPVTLVAVLAWSLWRRKRR